MSRPHPRPWHRGSLFGAGARRPLDRNQRARFRYLLNAHTRAHRLTDKHEKVGLALLKRLGTDGQCDPAQATLAEDAGCDERTVRRANDRMRELGLISWQRRLARAGWRTEQTSNQYELLTDAQPPVLPPPRCGGQAVRQTSSCTDSPLIPPAGRKLADILKPCPAIQAPIRTVAEQLALLGRG